MSQSYNEVKPMDGERFFTKNNAPVLVPTGDRRHMPFLREGKLSSEIFCHNSERRRELGLKEIFVNAE